MKQPRDDKGERTVTSTRLLLRADIELAPRDEASVWTQLADAVKREIEARGGRVDGSSGPGGEGLGANYTRGQSTGSITVWHVKGTAATHLAVWALEER